MIFVSDWLHSHFSWCRFNLFFRVPWTPSSMNYSVSVSVWTSKKYPSVLWMFLLQSLNPLPYKDGQLELFYVKFNIYSHLTGGRKLNFSYILSSLNSQSMVVKRTKVGSKHSVCIMFLLFTLLFIYYISFGADWALFLLHYTDHESWKLVCFPCCWFWFSSTSYHFFIHFVFWETLSRVLKYFF